MKVSFPSEKLSDVGYSTTVTDRDMKNIFRKICRRPEQTSKFISTPLGFLKYQRPQGMNNLLHCFLQSHFEVASSDPWHKILMIEWAKKYMKINMSHFHFTDESQRTLDVPGGCMGKGLGAVWELAPSEFRHQQQWRSVMIWTGIAYDRLLGHVRVPEGVKVTSASSCNILKYSSWLNDLPLSLRNFHSR